MRIQIKCLKFLFRGRHLSEEEDRRVAKLDESGAKAKGTIPTVGNIKLFEGTVLPVL